MTMAPARLLAMLTAAVLTTAEGWTLMECPDDCEGPTCEEEPEDCGVLGVATVCGRKVCKKGPNEPCGGRSNRRGVCADTLHCTRDFCQGCVILADGQARCSDWHHARITDGLRPFSNYPNFYVPESFPNP